MSLLPIIDACDNFRVEVESCTEPLYPFYIHVPPTPNDAIIGYLRSSIFAELENYNALLISNGQSPIWEILHTSPTSQNENENSHTSSTNNAGKVGTVNANSGSSSGRMVGFSSALDTAEKRSEAIKVMCEKWHGDREPFGELISGKMWRNELYPIYTNPFVLDEKTIAFQMERAATPLFGVVTYGVHAMMYTQDYRLWIARRALTKQTFGGMLDNTVAGGIPLGYSAWDSMVKECMEEGSLSEEVVVPNLKPAGAVSYFYRTSKGWLQPEVEYIYDLLVPAGKEESPEYIPKPFDGEVESFELLPIDIVREKMLAGEFKPNCALVIVDFMIRHGKLHSSNEPHLLEILSRIHGTFGYTRLG